MNPASPLPCIYTVTSRPLGKEKKIQKKTGGRDNGAVTITALSGPNLTYGVLVSTCMGMPVVMVPYSTQVGWVCVCT